MDDAYLQTFTIVMARAIRSRVVSMATEHPVPRAPRPKRFPVAWGFAPKLLIDVASLCRVGLHRHPIRSFFNMRQYDYNSVPHRANAYIKDLERGTRPA